MTGTQPAHLDLDALADALAGEADAQAAAHLSSCASCSSRLAELEAAAPRVAAALTALPDPALPDGLAERLRAALAGEPPLTAARASVTALPERRSRARVLPAAAAAVLLLSAGGLGYSLVTGSGDGATESAAGGGADSSGVAGLVLNASGTDYRDTAAVTSALPGVLAGTAGFVALQDGQADASSGGATSEGGGAGTADAPAAARSSGAPALPAPVAGAADPLARLRTPEGLQECLAAVLPPEEPDLQPRALDYAQYAGQPALAVLLPDPEPGKVSVFVVGPGCTRADAAVLGFFRVDAP